MLTDGRVMNWKHCEATAKQVYATIVKYHALKTSVPPLSQFFFKCISLKVNVKKV